MQFPAKSHVEPTERAAALYHVVYAHEGFEEAATALFGLVRNAEQAQPGKRRVLHLDIEGHRNPQGGYDTEMLELQRDFVLGFLSPFLAEAHLPLLGHVTNPRPQRNDIPDDLVIKLAEHDSDGTL
jgi:hypothetical protein